jgi:two-component system sensor histidine kinase/response regulator
MSETGTILVVDDTDANRYVLARLLVKAGYTVLESASGNEGLARAAEDVELVMLDVNLPDLKGTEVCRRIKQNLGDEAPLVLQMSASFTRSQDRIDGLDSGADCYLVQPIAPAEMLATVRSLLRLRRSEQALKRANLELQRSAHQLARSNEDLENFAYIVSHDMQEPLRMVRMFLDLLSKRYAAQLDERARGYIEQAHGGAARMNGLIKGVLTLAQLQRSAMTLQRFPADLALDDALSNLSIRVSESKARIERVPLPAITADRGLITQVLQNLLSNAIKFHGGAPEIRVWAEPTEGGQRISIADRGPGIDPRHHQRVFELFQRLQTAAEAGGNGVGLAIVKKIVERHGGEVGLRSAPGDGATFSFTIPDAVPTP